MTLWYVEDGHLIAEFSEISCRGFRAVPLTARDTTSEGMAALAARMIEYSLRAQDSLRRSMLNTKPINPKRYS